MTEDAVIEQKIDKLLDMLEHSPDSFRFKGYAYNREPLVDKNSICSMIQAYRKNARMRGAHKKTILFWMNEVYRALRDL